MTSQSRICRGRGSTTGRSVYTTPYRWASFAAVPFTPLGKPLSQACVAFVTTAARFDPALGDQGPGANYNGAAKFYTVYSAATAEDADLRISHVAYDRTHTTAADQRSYNPRTAFGAAAAAGRIGRLAPRFHGAPTNRSQRVTMQTGRTGDPVALPEDGVDAVVLVPNCPVCHQSCALVARHLEAAGIATVVMAQPRTWWSIAASPASASATSRWVTQRAVRMTRYPRQRPWSWRCAC